VRLFKYNFLFEVTTPDSQCKSFPARGVHCATNAYSISIASHEVRHLTKMTILGLDLL
jgi:hypothetical protein